MNNQEKSLENNDKIIEIIKDFMGNSGFTVRKITDTPTDDLMVVPRKYVNMYGSIAGAPKSSIVGQQYFATDLGYPIFKNQNTRWVNGVGSVVG